MILREVASIVKVSFVTLRNRWRFVWRYLRGDAPWDSGICPPELMAFIQQHPAGKALDLGCGTGTNAIVLAQHGWQVHAIDFAAPAIQRARYKAQQANVSAHFYHRSVAQTDDLPAPFDLVLDIGCYHGLPRQTQKQYADNLERLLAPTGTMLLYAHLKSANQQTSHGLDEEALHLLTRHLRVVQRVTGEDGMRTSIWLTLVPKFKEQATQKA